MDDGHCGVTSVGRNVFRSKDEKDEFDNGIVDSDDDAAPPPSLSSDSDLDSDSESIIQSGGDAFSANSVTSEQVDDHGDGDNVASAASHSFCPPDGFRIVRLYTVPDAGIIDVLTTSGAVSHAAVTYARRLQLVPTNVAVPAALMTLDCGRYPSPSRARKACRQGKIALYRRTVVRGEQLVEKTAEKDEEGGSAAQTVMVSAGEDDANANAASSLSSYDYAPPTRGRVDDRVHPGDVLAAIVRISHGAYSPYVGIRARPPSFHVAVAYEDHHVAVVIKPPGVVTYTERQSRSNGGGGGRGGGGRGGGGRRHCRGDDTLKTALPHVLSPPPPQTLGKPLSRPEPRHRLDRPTCGLVVVAKTAHAAADITSQFQRRIVRKTYVAIVWGVPRCNVSSEVSHLDAIKMGADVDTMSHGEDETGRGEGESVEVNDYGGGGGGYNDGKIDPQWQVARCDLDGKEAVTLWRIVRTYTPNKGGGDKVASKGCDGVGRSGGGGEGGQEGNERKCGNGGAIGGNGNGKKSLSFLELKPLTGRYHQLRRQMAWLYGCPIVGDAVYGGLGYGPAVGIERKETTSMSPTTMTTTTKVNDANNDVEKTTSRSQFRRGFMLCSNRITFQHPYYNNTDEGRREWRRRRRRRRRRRSDKDGNEPRNNSDEGEDGDGDGDGDGGEREHKGGIRKSRSFLLEEEEEEEEGSVVIVRAAINLPNKFQRFLSILEKKEGCTV